MRLPFSPCCLEHSVKHSSKWPAFDDVVDWPDYAESPLYKYYTIFDGNLYELTATDPPNHYSIYRMPKDENDEKTLINQIPVVHRPDQDPDHREKMAELRAMLPIRVREVHGGLLR